MASDRETLLDIDSSFDSALGFSDESLQGASTTVSLTSIDHVAAWASNELFHDGASQYVVQRGDGIGHVTLSALGCRAGCNLGVGKVFLIE